MTNPYDLNSITKNVKTLSERKFDILEFEIQQIKDVISQLKTEILDIKEAFEHTDDSLQRVRSDIDNLDSRD